MLFEGADFQPSVSSVRARSTGDEGTTFPLSNLRSALQP